MKGVREAVPVVNFCAESRLHVLQRSQGDVRCEHQRACRRAWHDRSVNRFVSWWTAPGFVSSLAQRTSNAPDIFRIAGKLGCQINTELPMCLRCGHGILKPVRPRLSAVASAPVVDEGVGKLMSEEWRGS